MARARNENKRPRKQSSETRSFFISIRRKPTTTPFTMQTRTRAKTSDVVVKTTSTQSKNLVSGQQDVEVDNGLNRPVLSSPLSTSNDSSSDDGLGILDSFRWNADEQSESTSIRHLQDINSSISEALVPVLCLLKERMSHYKRRCTVFGTARHPAIRDLDPRSAGPLVQELYAARLAQSRFIFGDEVIEALLQDTICETLHQTFFAGKIFFGIQHTADQKSALDIMFETLLKKETWTVAQRWRSFASSAPTLEPQVVKDTLVKIVVQIQENVRRAFDIVYPTASRSRFRKLVNEFVQMLERPIKEIVDKSNELSIALQREVVTSRLKVVLSLPENDAAEIVHEKRALGTVSMGLRAIRPGPDKSMNVKVLLAPTTITASLFSAAKK